MAILHGSVQAEMSRKPVMPARVERGAPASGRSARVGRGARAGDRTRTALLS